MNRRQSQARIEELEAREAAVRKIVDFWFAPLGAAKAAEWEDLSGDRAFTPELALELLRALLNRGKDAGDPDAG